MKKLVLLTALPLLLLAGCATSGGKMDNTVERQLFNSPYDSGAGVQPGFRYDEARDFVEFCIELNSQDDRQKYPGNPVYVPRFNPKWHVIYDSRVQVAKAQSGATPDQDCNDNPGCKSISDDPDRNGFGPFQNAWVLYQDSTAPDTYAIAIRGTVVSNSPTLIEDLLATTVPANNGMEFKENKFAPVRFADLADAEVHAGFSYGTFVTLFDSEYGILRQLEAQKIPAGAKLYIAGHSQGAAMATLVHAFLHYAMRDQQFGLGGKGYKLKSYAFAQPKPGNHIFGMDFANITQQHNNAIVINNTLDPVPKVPFTFELTADWDSDIQGKGFWITAIHKIAGAGMWIRGNFSSAVEKKIAQAKQLEKLYRIDEWEREAKHHIPSGDSLNYVSAGALVPVDGYVVSKDATNPYAGQPNDPFIQHHAASYRQLIEEKFGPHN